MKNQKWTHKLAAAITAGMMVGQSEGAFAQVTFSSVTDNIVTSSEHLPNLISTVAYVGGVGMGVAGVFKLKQHVDNPNNAPMKDGLVRLGAGGGLLALPYLTQAMTGTLSNGDKGAGPTIQKFDQLNGLH